MKVLRSAIAHLFSSLFSIGLSLLITGIFFSLTLAKPTTVISWLTEANFYENLAQTVIEESLKVESNGDSEALIAAVGQTLTPSVYQNYGDQVIEGTYTWLKGDANEPTFKIDVSSLEQEFLVNLGQEVERRAPDLPVCSDQASTLAAIDDPLASDCRPTGVTPSQISLRVTETVQSEGGLFDQPVYTASNLVNDKGESVFTKYSYAPQIYQVLESLPIAGSVILLFSTIVLFIFKDRRSAFRALGSRLLTSAVFGAATAAASYWIITRTEVAGDGGSAKIIQDLLPVVAGSILTISLIISGVSAAIGVVMLVLSRRFAKPE